MLKRAVSLVISIIIFSGAVLSAPCAYAQEVREGSYGKTGVYVITQECPAGYLDYAVKNLYGFLASISSDEFPSGCSITLGTPFCFANQGSDIFYFPVLCDGEIIYMLRVFPKAAGGYGGVMGKTFVDEFKSVASKTSDRNPLAVMMEGKEVAVYLGQERTVIYKYPEEFGSSVKLETGSLLNSSQVVDITESSIDFQISAEAINCDINNETDTYSITSIPPVKYLSTSITETQGSEDWCAAYSTAMIFRFLDQDDTTALDIMTYMFGPNPSYTQNLYRADVVAYSNLRNRYPTWTWVTLSRDSIVNEIVNNSPVYLSLHKISTSVYHAVVLRGYQLSYNKWNIWNPWYPYYEDMEIGGIYVPVADSTVEYEYNEAIYEFWRTGNQ